MKIKIQLRLFFFIIIIFPILNITILHVYSYYRSPRNIMIKRLAEIEKQGLASLNEKEWQKVKCTIQRMPPNVKAAFIANNSVLFSSIPELKTNEKFGNKELLDILKTSRGDNFYQFELPPMGTEENRAIFISRINKRTDKRNNYYFDFIFFSMIFFITVCIMMMYLISESIFSSLMKLKHQTQKIANGNLNLSLETINEKGNEITELTKNLETMRLSLLENQNRRSRFIMGISHDLRTPIAVIKGYVEAISDGVMNSPEQLDSALEIITQKTEQLEQMVDSLINYEKLKTNEWHDKLELKYLSPILLDFAKTSEYTGSLFQKTVNSNIRISPETQVNLNEQLLTRVFENLFSNALRYTKKYGIINIDAYETESMIYISIKDDGYGIEKSEIKSIFDLFYRTTNSRREEGMGIGLSVVKNIMDIHGWHIEVESEKGKGSVFTIKIPKS